jgi:hypothetical protein
MGPLEKEGLRALIVVALLFAALAVSVMAGDGRGSSAEAACSGLLRHVGTCSLCLSSECSCARNLSDGIHGSMADMPAGYCHHQVCDVTAPPSLPRCSLYEMRILRKGQ